VSVAYRRSDGVVGVVCGDQFYYWKSVSVAYRRFDGTVCVHKFYDWQFVSIAYRCSVVIVCVVCGHRFHYWKSVSVAYTLVCCLGDQVDTVHTVCDGYRIGHFLMDTVPTNEHPSSVVNDFVACCRSVWSCIVVVT